MQVLSRSLWFYLIIGLVQGVVIWHSDALDMSGDYRLLAAVVTALLVGGTLLQLLGDTASRPRALLVALGFTLLVAGISAWVLTSHGKSLMQWQWASWSWLFSLVLLSYIASVFIVAWATSADRRVRYEALFRHAWNNVFIVGFALAMTVLFGLLVALWNKLFLMVGIEWFATHLLSAGFLCVSIGVVFSLAMWLGRRNEKIFALLSSLLFNACRYLLPLIALISVLFTLALPFTGLRQIWFTGYSTPILLLLAGVHLLLLNGVFQDGRQPHPYPRWMLRGIDLSLLCPPLLVGLAAYSSGLRVDQYGLTPLRFVALLLTLLLGIYSLLVVWAVALRSSSWLGSLRVSNPLMGGMCAVVLVLLNSPWLNPLEISAKYQVQQLLDGSLKVENFDPYYLHYNLGEFGDSAFSALEEALKEESILDADSRRTLDRKMREAKGSGKWYDSLSTEESVPVLEWIGPEEPGSEQFVQLNGSEHRCLLSGCVLWGVDLDGDGRHEVVQIPRSDYNEPVRIFSRAAGDKWEAVGVMRGNNEDGRYDPQSLINRIRDGQVKRVSPRYKSLDVDGMLLAPVALP